MAANPSQIPIAAFDAADLNALRSAVEGFSPEQLIWSSGFLAGLAGMPANGGLATAAVPAGDVHEAAETWHVYYATETGNSRSVAEQLVASAKGAGLAFELHDIVTTRPKSLRDVSNAIFVLATHGIGEPPEGSESFFDFWMAETAPRLEKLRFSVLALGDSSYADYCEAGRLFDARLRELGATAVAERVDCDLDFETPASDWSGRIIDLADKDTTGKQGSRPAYLSAVTTTAPVHDRSSPFTAAITMRQTLSGRDSSKKVQHLEIDLEDSGMRYEPGDSLGVWADNPPQVIDSVYQATGLDADVISDKEITALSRPLLEAVAGQHPELQAILSDRERFADYLATRQLVDLAHEFPVDWTDPSYVDALRALSPRSYSIASSPDANPGEAHLTVAVVDYDAHGRRHWGSASNFLSGNADTVPVFVEKNAAFRLPDDPETPIIMIGAGTGVAPYRAFVEHRREHGHSGKNWLIFGDRNLGSDFLYQLEWLRYRKEKLLTRLDVAFSRDQPEKRYVQHRLIEHGQQVYAWLEEGAHLYVCGDATRMAGDVHAALAAVVATHGKLSDADTAGYLKALKRDRRYQRDVY